MRSDVADHEQPGQPDCSVRLERVLVKQEGEVSADSVRNELARDMWSMIAGFLKGDRMKSSASRRKDVCRILACWARIPLEQREAVLVMHEVAVCVETGAMPAELSLRKTRHRKYRRHGVGKGFINVRAALLTKGCVPAGAALASGS